MQNKEADLIQESSGVDMIQDSTEYWLEFAKTQSLVSELLQFELDGLSDIVEQKVKNIEDVFYSLSSISKGDELDDAKLEKLSSNLETIVKNIQFQDLVSQKIENICNSLKILQSYSEELIDRSKENSDVDISNLLSNSMYIERIIKERTLEEMRSSMLRNLENVSKVDYDLISEKLSNKLTKQCSKDYTGDDIEIF